MIAARYKVHSYGGAQMPRYFFHVSSGTGKIPDTQGYEFSCAERACLYAHRIAREAQTYLDEEDGRWMVHITSEEGDLEIIVLFPSARFC